MNGGPLYGENPLEISIKSWHKIAKEQKYEAEKNTL